MLQNFKQYFYQAIRISGHNKIKRCLNLNSLKV